MFYCWCCAEKSVFFLYLWAFFGDSGLFYCVPRAGHGREAIKNRIFTRVFGPPLPATLKRRRRCYKAEGRPEVDGGVPEWSNGTVSKTVGAPWVPWVRIPPPPPLPYSLHPRIPRRDRPPCYPQKSGHRGFSIVYKSAMIPRGFDEGQVIMKITYLTYLI